MGTVPRGAAVLRPEAVAQQPGRWRRHRPIWITRITWITSPARSERQHVATAGGPMPSVIVRCVARAYASRVRPPAANAPPVGSDTCSHVDRPDTAGSGRWPRLAPQTIPPRSGCGSPANRQTVDSAMSLPRRSVPIQEWDCVQANDSPERRTGRACESMDLTRHSPRTFVTCRRWSGSAESLHRLPQGRCASVARYDRDSRGSRGAWAACLPMLRT